MQNSQELYDAFRTDTDDLARPYLWTDDEVWRYADAAYRAFVRFTGGIADFTSNATKVDLSIGTDEYALDPSILRIMTANLASDGSEVKVINATDLPAVMSTTDYGHLRSLTVKNTDGPVRYLLMGMQQNLAKVLQIPVAVDTINLFVYRLPQVHITDGSHPLNDIAEDHHLYLLDGMKHLAYKKQDSETFNKTKSEDAEQSFRAYCAQCKSEWERYKHKTRVVQYGGL